LTIKDHFGKNLIDLSTMPDIVDFDNARAFIDAVYDPVTLGSKRQVPSQFALKAFSRMRILSQLLDRSFDDRLQRRRQPEDLPAAGSRIDKPVGTRHGSAQASSWVMTLPVWNSFDDLARAFTTLRSANISMVSNNPS